MVLERSDSEPDCQADIWDDGELGYLLHIVTRRIIVLDSIFTIVHIQNFEKSTYLPSFTMPCLAHTYI